MLNRLNPDFCWLKPHFCCFNREKSSRFVAHFLVPCLVYHPTGHRGNEAATGLDPVTRPWDVSSWLRNGDWSNYWLVVTGTWILFFHSVEKFIIPIDELIFSEGCTTSKIRSMTFSKHDGHDYSQDSWKAFKHDTTFDAWYRFRLMLGKLPWRVLHWHALAIGLGESCNML